jgi:hypothetical protein
MSQRPHSPTQTQPQPLRLRNPTPYHLLAINQQQVYANNNSSPHPLADIDAQHQQQHQQQQPFGMGNRDSPASSSNDHIEFNDSFSQNIMNSISATSPQMHDYHDDHNEYRGGNHMYDNRSSFSSQNGHPMVSQSVTIIDREGN